MRARTFLITLLDAVPAARGHGRRRLRRKFTIRGAGFGHGVGMSQYGAYGYAHNGASYRDILGHYYTGTAIGQANPGQRVRVLLQSVRGSASLHRRDARRGADAVGAQDLLRARGAAAPVELRYARGRKLGTYTRRCGSTGRGGR